MPSYYYRLVDRKVVGYDSMEEYVQAEEKAQNGELTVSSQIKHDVFGEVRISTVFLFIDHGLDAGGPPVLFETMIFGGEYNEYQERYITIEDAEAGHERALEMCGFKRPVVINDEDIPLQISKRKLKL